jgi:hypothetical protein
MLSFFRKKPSEPELNKSPQTPEREINGVLESEDGNKALFLKLGYKNKNDLKETIYGNNSSLALFYCLLFNFI